MSNETENFNLEPGDDEQLSGTYTWVGADGESKVIVQSPTETTELTGGSVIFTDRASGEKGSVVLTNTENNLILRAENELSFKDSTQATAVTLSNLVGGAGSGRLQDLTDVTITNPKVGDVVKFTATGWVNGADATGGGVDGNPCGTGDDYTQSNRPETISEPWTWVDAGCPSITVGATEGEFAQDHAEICPNAFIVRSDIGLEGRLKSRGSDGQIELRVNGGQLYFRDDVISQPIRLAELVQGVGSTSRGFAPIIRNFEIDEANSNKEGTLNWELEDGFAKFSYPGDWAGTIPTGRVTKAINTRAKTVTMPKGANGAIVFLQGKVEMSVPGEPGLSALGSQRALHASKRVKITNATFPIPPAGVTNAKTGFGEVVKGIVTIPGNAPSILENYSVTKSFDKFDVINFSDQASVTFETQLDILKGGRGQFEASAGRIVIFPFYSDSPGDYSIVPDLETFAVTTDEDDLNAIYDIISPNLTPAEEAGISASEYRDLLRRILASLESRKAYPPAGGATEAEFNAQIQAGWALVDDSTLQTQDEFTAALEVYYTEVTKEKYGISILFEYQKEAGATVRSLI